MIPIYLFLSFVFFKIFAAIAIPVHLSAFSAFMLAIASTIGIFGMTFWLSEVMRPYNRGLEQPPAEPVLGVCFVGVLATVFLTWLVAIGFAETLLDYAHRRYRGSPTLVYSMFAIPPIAHAIFLISSAKPKF